MTKFNDCRAAVICSSLITRFTILRVEARQTFVPFWFHAPSHRKFKLTFSKCSRILRGCISDTNSDTDQIQMDANDEMAIRRTEIPSKLWLIDVMVLITFLNVAD